MQSVIDWVGKRDVISVPLRKIHDILQRILVQQISRVSANQHAELDLLVQKFSQASPFRPLDLFDVNFATAASLASVAFTYVIVLLQFKIGDSSWG